MMDLICPRFFVYLLLIVSILNVAPDTAWSLDKTVAPPTKKSNEYSSPAGPPASAAPAGTVAATSVEQLFEQQKFQEVVDRLSPEVGKLTDKQMKLLGRSQSALKNSSSAIKTFSLILSKNPKDAEAKMYLGIEYSLIGNKEREAMINLREALDLNPKLEAAYLAIENLYIKKNNKYELRTLYTDMIERLGEKPEYVTRLCELFSQSGIYDVAKTYCRRGIALQPKNAKNYVVLAQTMKEVGDVDAAKSLLKKTADKFNESVDAQMGYAQFLDEQKNFLEANSYYKRATLADPKYTKAWLGFSFSALELEKYQDSLDGFVEACKLDRRSSEQLRRAISSLRLLKLVAWQTKFEALNETCGLPTHDSN